MNLLTATADVGTGTLSSDDPGRPPLEVVVLTIKGVDLDTDIEHLVTIALPSPLAAQLGGKLRRTGRNTPSPATQLEGTR